VRYFEDYCECHLELGSAPFQWVWRSNEKIRIRFGVSVFKEPDCGQIILETCDAQGYATIERITAKTEFIAKNNFKMFSVTLPPGANGSRYRYRLGYRDSQGVSHTSEQIRDIMICDEAPRSVGEIEYALLDVVDNHPLYGPAPQVQITPGPQDWDKRLFYMLMIDRFAVSQEENRTKLGIVPYDLSVPHTSHGGTLLGVCEKLEYLKSLGVGALIISPVYVNEASGYHGYHPVNLLMVDPRLGTLESLQTLVTKAHELDIAVILDVVVNHLADSIDWEKYGGPPGGEFKYVRGDATAVMPYPLEARNTALFHGPEHTDMINQRLFEFLEDWRTETTYVRELLIQHLKYWLAVTNVDGFRYDAVRHVGLDFWQPCVEEISRYAKYLGKKLFLQIAEHAGSCHTELTAYNGANFSSMLDYPNYYQLKHSLGRGQNLSPFSDYFCGFMEPGEPYAAGWQNNLMFLDNQDTTRIFHEFLSRHGTRDTARACLHFALACLILGPQIPAIYMGTEQEFSGAKGMHYDQDRREWIGHDFHVREDMFDNPACVWKFGPINRKTFPPYSQDHKTFKLIQQLAIIRRQSPVFTEGERTVLVSQDNGLRCVILHSQQESPPLVAILNVGMSQITEIGLAVPKDYGKILGVDILVTAADGRLKWEHDRMQVQCPPFAFVLAQLVTKTSAKRQEQFSAEDAVLPFPVVGSNYILTNREPS